MNMKVLQTNTFKKLHKSEKNDLDKQVQLIIKNPDIGQQKKGDLADIRVHKFKIKSKLMLLAYKYDEDYIKLIVLGSHENFYRDLKN